MAAIYSKYLRQKFLVYFAASLSALVVAVWLVQALRLMEILTKGGVPILLFLKMALYLVIPLLYVCIPIALFLASIFSINSLNNAGELITLKASGLSDSQIIAAFKHLFLVLYILHSAISLYCLPYSYREFHHMQYTMRDGIVKNIFEESVFTNYGNGLTFYVQKKIDDKTYENIFINDMRKNDENITLIAKLGKFSATENGIGIILFNGTHQSKRADAQKINIGFFEKYQFIISSNAVGNMNDRKINANEMYWTELWSAVGKTDAAVHQHRAQAWQRVVWPILGTVLSLYSLGRTLNINASHRISNLKHNILTATFGMLAIALFLLGSSLAMQNWMYLSLPIIVIIACILYGIDRTKNGEVII
jgi:lipopolysaccharide export system permease protein